MFDFSMSEVHLVQSLSRIASMVGAIRLVYTKRELIGELSMTISYDDWLTFFDFFVKQLQRD